jgi:hypothetical protein
VRLFEFATVLVDECLKDALDVSANRLHVIRAIFRNSGLGVRGRRKCDCRKDYRFDHAHTIAPFRPACNGESVNGLCAAANGGKNPFAERSYNRQQACA